MRLESAAKRSVWSISNPLRSFGYLQTSVDKVYIHTAKDQVVSPALQAAMVTATPVRYEATLNTGHTPFLTDVPGLTAAIEKAAR